MIPKKKYKALFSVQLWKSYKGFNETNYLDSLRIDIYNVCLFSILHF